MLTAVEYRGTPLTRVSQRSTISWLVHTQRASFPDRLELEIADMFVCLRFSRHAIPIFLRASPSPTICWSVPSLIYMRCVFGIKGLLFAQKLSQLCVLAFLPRRTQHWETVVHCVVERTPHAVARGHSLSPAHCIDRIRPLSTRSTFINLFNRQSCAFLLQRNRE